MLERLAPALDHNKEILQRILSFLKVILLWLLDFLQGKGHNKRITATLWDSWDIWQVL